MSIKLINSLGEYHKKAINNMDEKELNKYVIFRKLISNRISNLPDSAFAIILPGGRRDKFGKTIPRNLRKFVHHTKYVKDVGDNNSVDVVYLRQALIDIVDSKIPAGMKAKGERHLRRHAKTILKRDRNRMERTDGKSMEKRK